MKNPNVDGYCRILRSFETQTGAPQFRLHFLLKEQ